jgi:hypothetical protein
MKFLIDRCAGKVVADWLRGAGHDLLIMEDLLTRFSQQLEDRAIVTVRGGRVRISRTETD